MKHIWFVLVVKASFWQQLPWQILLVAHNTLHLARACLQWLKEKQ